VHNNRPLKNTILLFEDDTKLAKLIRNYLQNQEFLVKIETRGDKAIDQVLIENPDLIILDIRLRGMDGLTICKNIRSEFRHPILILTDKKEESEELVYLESGADEYMFKPVRPQILLARIRMLLRRAQRYNNGTQQLNLGSIIIDLGKRLVQINKKIIYLSTVEFDLLLYLAKNAGEVLSRDQLSLVLHGREWSGIDRSIDLCVSRLRKKLGDNGQKPRRIRSIRNTGYVLIPD
jgi:two-component system, OmpR family, response regulator RstA